MKTLSSIAVAGLLCLSAHGASLVNGTFDDGLTGWNTLGNVQAFSGVLEPGGPVEGVALLSTSGGVDYATWSATGLRVEEHFRGSGAGSAIWQTFTMDEIFVLYWQGDAPAITFLNRTGGVGPVPDGWDPGIHLSGTWHSGATEFIWLQPGEWTVTFGSWGTDVTGVMRSVEILDDIPPEFRPPPSVPEPSSALALLPIAIIGLVLRRHR